MWAVDVFFPLAIDIHMPVATPVLNYIRKRIVCACDFSHPCLVSFRCVSSTYRITVHVMSIVLLVPSTHTSKPALFTCDPFHTFPWPLFFPSLLIDLIPILLSLSIIVISASWERFYQVRPSSCQCCNSAPNSPLSILLGAYFIFDWFG